ncbi:MAG: class I SAM-dependent methyltransferase [Nitriliruptoraceae bacterium]|nr:class I SAM-dependent methyltransferase [Nitriliruptoraceae bacterium]
MTASRIQDPERREAIVGLWTDGCYEDIGALFEPATTALVEELGVEGLRVLDAATGTGNTALAAAARGAEVDACDLTPRLLTVARQRAAERDLEVRFREGDLLALPYDDASFDLVLSTFGAFTADDPRACARELVRVCVSGGRIVSTAWADEGMFARSIDLIMAELPDDLFAGRPNPQDWADPLALRGLFAGLDVELAVEHRTAWFPFDSLDGAFALLESASGPFLRLRTAMDAIDDTAWPRVRTATLQAWGELSRPGAEGGVELPAVYGIATITRP